VPVVRCDDHPKTPAPRRAAVTGVRETANLLKRFKLMLPIQPVAKKIPLCPDGQISDFACFVLV
jgi:hypothetical protein